VQPREPSRTALSIARLRAAHQLLDGDPKILLDPLATGFVPGSTQDEIRAKEKKFQSRHYRAIRAMSVLRSRYVEDVLREVSASGTRQHVNLGAGLDTFAYRQPPWARSLTLFEVDRQATQEWKRANLKRLGIAIPTNLRFCAVDFETGVLSDGLRVAGFDFQTPTCFSCLGVTQYLTEVTLDSTLRFVRSMPAGSSIVFTFVLPDSCLEPKDRKLVAIAAELASPHGEPFRTRLAPGLLHDHLIELGFSRVVLLAAEEANRRYFRARCDGLRAPGYENLVWSTV
jgi:methyltransferase (TIGR00027 family)